MILSILGEYGQGKTLTLTCLAYLASLWKIPIYSNYELRGISHFRIESIDDLENVKTGFLAMDEMWYSMDARDVMTKKNKKVSVIVSKGRKRGITWASTEQSMDLVEKRVRDRTNYILLPETDNPDDPAFVTVYLYKKNRFGEFVELDKRLVFKVSMIKNLYDTCEELMPLEVVG